MYIGTHSVESLFLFLAGYKASLRGHTDHNTSRYIRFRDAVSEHRLQVREWGAYQLLAQEAYADRPDSLWNAPGYRSGKDLWIVVGNMTNYRKNWMVIKTFEADAKGPELFDDVTIEDG